jgi:hypothetical protein
LVRLGLKSNIAVRKLSFLNHFLNLLE